MSKRSSVFAIFAIGTAAGTGIWLGGRHNSGPIITFMNVGQGDCTVIQSGSTAILIDDGPFVRNLDGGTKIVVPKLREMGITDVSLVLLTHPDLDHVGGTLAIRKAFPDARVAFSKRFQHRPEVEVELRKWNLPESSVWWMGDQETVRIGELRLDIVCPKISLHQPTNDGSIFVHVRDGAAAMVVSGDAPTEVEDQLAGQGDWRSDVMHVGHHGSKTSTGDQWLEAVRPRFAVISCGKHNEYGHPHRVVVDRLARNHIQILRTDEVGDIRFKLSGSHFVPDR